MFGSVSRGNLRSVNTEVQAALGHHPDAQLLEGISSIMNTVLCSKSACTKQDMALQAAGRALGPLPPLSKRLHVHPSNPPFPLPPLLQCLPPSPPPDTAQPLPPPHLHKLKGLTMQVESKQSVTSAEFLHDGQVLASAGKFADSLFSTFVTAFLTISISEGLQTMFIRLCYLPRDLWSMCKDPNVQHWLMVSVYCMGVWVC